MTESYFETVEIGEQRETQARTVTEADVVNFAGVSGDFNHLHTDAETMGESQFGERIAHGMLVFSMATGLLWQSRSEQERDAVVAFYGIDEVRFVGPTFIGDTIHVEIEVLDKQERDHPVATGVVRYDIDVVTQDDDTVLSCEMLSLVT
ncbi:MaoC/PaaZ C-terminal domain-containing protein [Halorientalis pallida]|uniref:Monoamine oxidase n=1 Tax=Halorientalis pallida TaxID=2479928 RepID=A0A498L3E7_9EURY|nr:MaoC/PaaZ C-terminal domain-containing protein [Halorientalis pallida]RXK49394.1 monoamine oxidase [Halorientalis pallida]